MTYLILGFNFVIFLNERLILAVRDFMPAEDLLENIDLEVVSFRVEVVLGEN